MAKSDRCKKGTRRNKKTGNCEKPFADASGITSRPTSQLSLSMFFSIVNTLLETSKTYYENLDEGEEEVEEAPNELMRVHLSNAFQILVDTGYMKADTLKQINQLANRAFLEMMRDGFEMPQKKADKIAGQLAQGLELESTDSLIVSRDALIYFWAVKQNRDLFPAHFIN
jgi:hypothetical protein